MRRLALFALAFSTVLGASAAGKVRRDKGLRQGPGMNRWSEEAPGTTKRLPRPYPGAPPIVPHGLDGLTITRDSNSCLGCHLEGGDLGDGHVATRVPPSHFTNPRTKETRTDTVVGMRYQCLQCHVPRAVGATPPVGQKAP